MILPLTVLLCSLPAAPSVPPSANLDFANGTTKGWESEGFTLAPGKGNGPVVTFGVCSADGPKSGRTGILHRTITVPAGGGVLYCTAFASRPKKVDSNGSLDVLVVGAGKKVVPRLIRSNGVWKESSRLLPRDGMKARQYMWRLDAFAGQTLRVAVVDDDNRPGCHVFCSGFRLLPMDPHQTPDFVKQMLKLREEHKLSPVERFETKHFVAISNTGDEFTTHRLHNCELIYDLFFAHFRKKGFNVYEPSGKMMAAVFDTHTGFEAYMGEPMPLGVTGVYHPKTNRLVVYDYGSNQAFKAAKDGATASGRRIGSDLDRIRYVETINRLAQEWRTDTNISTIMHEVAHQLSFNCGLLNRDGDNPVWLAEGLATYCEATENGSWLGIGEKNSERIAVLAQALANPKKMPMVPMTELVAGDAWRENLNGQTALVGYSQSWALFKMLMEERPAQLKKFLERIYDRKTNGSRLQDFAACFGTDLVRLELRYEAYIREQVEAWKPPR